VQWAEGQQQGKGGAAGEEGGSWRTSRPPLPLMGMAARHMSTALCTCFDALKAAHGMALLGNTVRWALLPAHQRANHQPSIIIERHQPLAAKDASSGRRRKSHRGNWRARHWVVCGRHLSVKNCTRVIGGCAGGISQSMASPRHLVASPRHLSVKNCTRAVASAPVQPPFGGRSDRPSAWFVTETWRRGGAVRPPGTGQCRMGRGRARNVVWACWGCWGCGDAQLAVSRRTRE